jgi:predicted GIY-YIG superfamily endonuclease/DNA-binding CsgD family transcriptional regulator
MENEKYYVYALSSSEDDIIRYIGITNNLKRRLNKHLHSFKHKTTKVSSWIKNVINNNFTLKMSIIDEVNDYNLLNQKEIEYIKIFKSCGANLKNLTLGGKSTIGYKHTVESKIKISKNNAKARLGTRKYNINDDLIKILFTQGKNNSEISKILNIPNTAVKESRKRQSLFYTLSKNRNINKLNITSEELYRLYILNKLSKKEIAKMYNCSERTIKKYLSKYKIYKNV